MAPIQLPKPSELTSREKEQAMAGYTMMFASFFIGLPIPFVGILASYVYYYANKKTSNFVAFHSFQSFLTQVPISLMNTGLIVWLVIAFIKKDFHSGFITYAIVVGSLNFMYFIFSLIGAVMGTK